MAHIATCIANMEPGSLSKPPSPALSILSTTQPPTSSIDRSFTWRMLPTEQRKYQLFPKDKPAPSLNTSKSLDPEAAFAVAMGERNDNWPAASVLRLRVNSVRRRKVSVPDLEPMTTVQEIAMDSPTIPGRPPLHERSSSAPEEGTDERQRAPKRSKDTPLPTGNNVAKSVNEILPLPAVQAPLSQSLPRQLAPLLIPTAELQAPLLQSKISSNKLRSDSTPPTSSRSARLDYSPLGRPRITPSTSTPDLLHPKSATSDSSSTVTLATPISAPLMEESRRASPKPWDGSSTFSSQSDRGIYGQDGQTKSHVHQHRRGASESSTTAIMDRGRPRKRADVRNNSRPLLKSNDTKRTLSCERRAFEELPKGWKPSDAVHKLHANDVVALQKQALGQAERFEVLRVEDVDALSKELRQLDERTDYLRRTYTSLRAGRRNLHSRICQYLRSPRVAKFSHDSMLKQEEALAELDASIDDWVTKLEQAENRRTRVRQKLLEHVAAAALLPVINSTSGFPESVQQKKSPGGPRELSTPPRSPSKTSFASRAGSASPSPQRVVAQVPSTIIEQPVVEDAAEEVGDISRTGSTVDLKRSGVESIRIYAGDDVYALLADVENEISRMGAGTPEPTASWDVQKQRQRSREQLTGRADCPSPHPPARGAAAPAASLAPNAATLMPTGASTASSSTQPTPYSHFQSTAAAPNRDGKNATPSPILPQAKDAAKQGEILLTAAVFKP